MVSSRGEIVVRVIGRRGDYWRYTITSWVNEVKDILEQEYNVRIKVVEEDGDVELPLIYVGDHLVLEGVPGEEGYLIEVLKKAFDNIIGRMD